MSLGGRGLVRVAIAGGLLAGLGFVAPPLPAAGRSPAPAQPAPFNHRLHAGTNKIGCRMCHAYAEHSSVAGIPSMARCFGCHKFAGRDKPAVQLVVKSFQDGKALEWNRVYRLPDHVFFTHQRHLAASLRCQECHGEVQEMEQLRPVRELEMGWCVDCHRARSAPTDCVLCHK